MSREKTKVLLYSGGMDSWLMAKLWKPDVLMYVNMDTRYSKRELEKLPLNEVRVVKFPLGQWEREDAIIPLRNLYLPMVVCDELPVEEYGDLEILLGATAGDRVLDKSPEFAEKASDILSYLYQPQHWCPEGRKVVVSVKYKTYTKTKLLAAYLKRGGSLKEAWSRSFSCYAPDEKGHECGECKPCFRKFVAFALNGMKFTHKQADKTCAYIEREIVPQIEAGTYGRAAEEREISKVLKMWKQGLLYEAPHGRRPSKRVSELAKMASDWTQEPDA